MTVKIPEDIGDLLQLARKYEVEFTNHTPMKFIISRTCRAIYSTSEWYAMTSVWTESIFPEDPLLSEVG